ncbi:VERNALIZATION-INSENSITIVE PROTEIN 3 [Salix koriyanagi]|uniref:VERNALIZATION-INSENSITIVE PROTEIN 3 n=1 Tax=Salix koriyanagi TaxID=2511006 RepID=A0A9Q1AET7_9ROSI|nr:VERNALIZATION-INSENSITIVE PROTEIN 3 [Salix koriyanagi]
MTRNSTENYEYSVGRDDQIWCGGEGTNGSVHSRFRPIADGVVALNNNNHGGGGGSIMQDAYSGDSRRRESENLRDLESGDGEGKAKKLSRPGRILREIVSESIPAMAQIIQELAEETLELTKDYLKNLIAMTEKRDELVGLQNRLQRRSDLTKEALLKCQREQLEILVAVKMGHGSFVSGKIRVPANELVEIFLFMRCRNLNCRSILPVDDCDCKFCTGNKGFCSSCTCPVCMNFDCASNTCSWVGCDVCSHWCHAACGIQKNLIRPGPSLRGPSGTTEMQFHCIGCNHASEMFGFVKDVFVCCAKDWGQETLIKELDCVRKIFKGSGDFKGKELHTKAEDLVSKLERKLMSSREACNVIIQFFNCKSSNFELLLFNAILYAISPHWLN